MRIALALLALMMLALPVGASPDHGAQGHGHGAQVYQVDLDPLNDSGVEGRAILIQKGDNLRVIVQARGLEAGKLHPQHIHGLEGDTEATCPTEDAQDDISGLPEEADDPDAFISVEEGVPAYGPVLQALTPFPTANPGSVVTYNQTFTVSGDLSDLGDEAIVLHGMTLEGGYAATLPVACGTIDG